MEVNHCQILSDVFCKRFEWAKHRRVLSLFYYLFNIAYLKSAGKVRNLWLM
jgi:hypothetical protein